MKNLLRSALIGFLVFNGAGLLAEMKPYIFLDAIVVDSQSDVVYKGGGLRGGGGWLLSNNFGLEGWLEIDRGGGGIVSELLGTIDYRFENIYSAGIIGLRSLKVTDRLSVIVKFGLQRSTVRYKFSKSIFGQARSTKLFSHQETNIVTGLGVARKIYDVIEMSFAFEQKISADPFNLGTNFGGSTYNIGFRFWFD